MTEPAVRADGLCVVCLKPRKITGHKAAREAAVADPFCSMPCARKWHDNPLPKRSIWSKPGTDRKFEAA